MNKITKVVFHNLTFSLFISLFTTTLIFGQTSTLSTEDFVNKNNQLLQKSIDDNIFIGVAAGISINGHNKWTAAKGYSDQEAKKAMELQTITRTASIAKSMTAIAVLQLFEQGLLDLDLPIQTYIPDFPRHKEGDITTRHLLSHTSGIDGYASGKEAQSQTEYASLSDAVNVFKNRKLRQKPGTAFYYTTYGYVVLGLIIEKISGLNYEEYMAKNIWEKAGMNHTGVKKHQVAITNETSLYHRNKKGKITLAKKENNLSNRAPAGGFYSCVEDLLRFGEAVINHELISKNTFKLMTALPTIENEGNPYGFGWFMYGDKANPNGAIGHGGEQTGVSGQIMLIPSRSAVIVVLGNTSGSLKEALILSVDLIHTARDLSEVGE